MMSIIKEELKKIYLFLLTLLVLYAVNLGFNMNYDWGGVSVIVRVYIMVLSCYLIYNFSQIDVEEHKPGYKAKYGKMGNFHLFLATRIFPFLFIYFMTILFTLINYVQRPGWPVDPFLKLMDGRYSNTVIYALILFIILKMKIRPGIAIPIFIAFSIFYFYTDKLLYRIFDPGAGVAVVKLLKVSGFYFILIYGFSKDKFKAIYAAAGGLAGGIVTIAAIMILFFEVFTFTSAGSSLYSTSAKVLLKSGFYYVFDDYRKAVVGHNMFKDITDLIIFSERGNRSIDYSPEEWENIIIQSDINTADYIFRYISKKQIVLNYEKIAGYAVIQSEKSPEEFLKSKNFKKYFAGYYISHSDSFFQMYNTGNNTVKKWIIDLLAYTDDYDSVIFLVNRLTDVDRKLSERAYASLKEITKLDPANTGKKEFHDIDVVFEFREYADNIRKR